MTPRQEVLTIARARLEAGYDIYICHALFQATVGRPDLDIAMRTLKEEINRGLADDGILSWHILNQMRTVNNPRPEPYHSAWIGENGVALMARLAWVDKLLEGCK